MHVSMGRDRDQSWTSPATAPSGAAGWRMFQMRPKTKRQRPPLLFGVESKNNRLKTTFPMSPCVTPTKWNSWQMRRKYEQSLAELEK